MAAPGIQIPKPDVSQEDCDRTLGLFMRAWDQLELALSSLFHKLVDTDVTTAMILFHSGIDLRTLREIIHQLGKHRLNPEDQKKLTALLRRAKNAATKRNRIVHGAWTLILRMGPPPRPKPLKAESATWIRQYRPTDKDVLAKLASRKSQKLVAAYQFRPNQLITSAGHVTKLARDINAFTKPLSLLPAAEPQPIEW